MRRFLAPLQLAALLLLAGTPASASFDGTHPLNHLYIPTYDGHGQQVHPSVVHRPEGWNGYEYWMVMCPYTCGSECSENPSVVASHDGLTWIEPPGIVNPLVAGPPCNGYTWVNNDPEMLFVGDSLVIYFLRTENGMYNYTDFRRLASADGVHWTPDEDAPTVLRLQNYPVSPSIVIENGRYYMWYVESLAGCNAGAQTIYRRESADGFDWEEADPVECSMSNSQDIPWHLDVVKDGSHWLMVYPAYPPGSTCGNTKLYYAESLDGLSWTAQWSPIVAPLAGNWDRTQVYRASVVPEDGLLRIWYSARADTCTPHGPWYVGYTAGHIGVENAHAPLTIPTYDDGGQQVHPDVLYTAAGWHGYEYWMAMAPYTCGDPGKTNPSIVASHDGQSWEVPGGLTNPLVPQPAGGVNDDPSLVMRADSLLLYYVETVGSTCRVRRLASADGIHWTAAASAPVMLERTAYLLSPTVVLDGGTYTMWFVSSSAGCTGGASALMRSTSSDGLQWSTPTAFSMLDAQGTIWHFNVKRAGPRYVMVYASYPAGSTCGQTKLYYAESADGATWKSQTSPLLSPSASGWDNGQIYQAGLVVTDHYLHLWYSARASSTCGYGGNPWHVGYAQGTVPDLTPPSATSTLAALVGRSTAAVSWTAPGDDAGVGTAAGYDLRLSTSPITVANFSSATPIATDSPGPAGTRECASVRGLSPCTTYYFALKAVDEAGNWSDLSNVPHPRTRCTGSFEVMCAEDGFRARGVTAEGEADELSLGAPRPNPSRDAVRMDYILPSLAKDAPYELEVFDVTGRRLTRLAGGATRAGHYTAAWDLRDAAGARVARGLYFVRLRLGPAVCVRTVSVIH